MARVDGSEHNPHIHTKPPEPSRKEIAGSLLAGIAFQSVESIFKPLNHEISESGTQLQEAFKKRTVAVITRGGGKASIETKTTTKIAMRSEISFKEMVNRETNARSMPSHKKANHVRHPPTHRK